MLKLELNKVEICPKSKLDLYNNMNPIPFSITIGEYTSLPATIYSRNLNGENFIEFRFDKTKRNLYEISLVAIQKNTVLNKPLSQLVKKEGLYVCNIIEENSLLEDIFPIELLRDSNSICINIINGKSPDVTYFAISNNCYVGVDKDFYLVSVLVNELSEENVYDIFGY